MITIAALTAVLLVTLDSTIATIALGRIQSNLAASPEQITWVLTSYLIAAAVMTPLAGWLADRFGRRRTMRTSVFFFTLSSLGYGLAPNLETLTLFRFLQGASGASLAEKVTPDNPLVGWRYGDIDFTSPLDVAVRSGEVARQGLILAYHHTFEMMFVLSLVMVVICLAMKPKKQSGAVAKPAPVFMD